MYGVCVEKNICMTFCTQISSVINEEGFLFSFSNLDNQKSDVIFKWFVQKKYDEWIKLGGTETIVNPITSDPLRITCCLLHITRSCG